MIEFGNIFLLIQVLTNQALLRVVRREQFGLLNIIFNEIQGLAGDLEFDVTQVINGVIEGIDDVLEGQQEAILASVKGLVETSEGEILDLGTGVTDALRGLIGSTGATLQQNTGRVLTGIGEVAQGALNFVAGAGGSVLGALGNIIGEGSSTVFDTINDLLGNISAPIRDALGTIEDFARGVIGILDEVTDQGIKSNIQIVEILQEGILPVIQESVESQQDTANKIGEALEQQIEQAQENAEAVQNGLEQAIGVIITESDSAIATTRDVLQASGAAQTQATVEGAEQVSEAVTNGTGDIAGEVGILNKTLSGDSDIDLVQAVKVAFRQVQGLTDCPPEMTDLLDEFMDRVVGEVTPLGLLANVQAALGSFDAFIGPMMQVLGNCSAQAAARLVSTSLATPPELQEQLRRGIVSQEAALQDLFSQGFNKERADNVLKARELLPDIGLIQTWFLRGFIDVDTAVIMLGQLGFKGADIQRVLEMSFFIPPVADLITMSVRDVFSPAIAERFGQFEDFPDDFQGFAAQQGVSEFWARNYWAAHWALPSATQGFEMFHRKVIDRDTLETLLRSLDVMPFWREALIQIAFKPLTRVDIRRMNALGLLDLEQVQARYEDIGFSPDDAALMTQFTEAFNAPDEGADADELARLTRSTVTKLFRRGVITRDEAKELLITQGIGEEAAEIFLTAEEVEQDIAIRDEQTDLIIAQAKSGLIDFGAAQDRLGQLGLTATELATALTRLERERAELTRIPSVGQLGDMFTQGIITNGQFGDALGALGFSSTWADRLIELKGSS